MLAVKTAFNRGRAAAAAATAPLRTASGTSQRSNPAAAMMGAPSARTVFARLTVTQGRHAGASLDLTKPQTTIGSALSSHVVLTDADVQPRHALISFMPEGTNVDGASSDVRMSAKFSARSKSAVMATIEAIDGNVLAGIQLIEAGQAIDVILPCTLKFGNCAVELTRPKTQRSSLIGNPATSSRSKRWWLWPAVATVAGATGLSLLGLYKTVTGEWAPSKLAMPRFDNIKVASPRDAQKTAMVQPVPSAAPARPLTAAPTSLASGAAAPALEPTPAVPLRPTAVVVTPTPAVAKPANGEDRQVADLRQRLLAAGLDKALSVEKRGNLLVVDGIVSSATYGRWREVKDAVSLTANTAGSAGNSVITDLVKTSTSANVPNNSIASVVLGKAPYVMSTNGRRARVGEVLEDGWTVEAITAETVTMRRGQTVNRINPADGFSK